MKTQLDLPMNFDTKSPREMEKDENLHIAYVKCGDKYDPLESHPNKYWDRNGKKFLPIFNEVKEQNGTLVIVTFNEVSNKIKRIFVKDVTAKTKIVDLKSKALLKASYKKWLKNLKNSTRIPDEKFR